MKFSNNFIHEQFDGMPCMKEAEIGAIKLVMEEWGNAEKRIIFEWGIGGSTKYFTDVLAGLKVDFEWHTVEHCSIWVDKVKSNIEDHRVHFHVLDYGKYTCEETRSLCMKEYVNAPLIVEKKFDLMLVDGRKRARCLCAAKSLLKDDGVVFLHDASRVHYHSALKKYKTSKMVLPDLWKGFSDNVKK